MNADEPGRARARLRRRWRRCWPYVVVAAVALLASALHAARYTELSPFDESRHLDYMIRLYDDGYVVKQGDKIGQAAMRIEACRGADIPNWSAPPCASGRFDPVDFRDEGFNNAINHPPGYYLVTGAVAKAVTVVGLSDNVLDPARVAGGLWLAAGLAFALFAGEFLRVNRVALVAAATLYALAPEPLFLAATVNPDGASVFAGGLVLVLAILWERGRIPAWWLAVGGAVAAALKFTNLIAVGIVAVWLLVQAWTRVRQTDDEPTHEVREYLVAVGLLVGSALGLSLLWMAVASARATVDALALPSNGQFYEPGFPFRALAMPQNLFSLFPPFGDYRAPVLRTDAVRDATTVTAWLAVTATVVAALRYSTRDRLSVLASWTGLFLVLAGPLFIVSTWVVNRVIFQPAARYGMSAIPMLVVATAVLVRGRAATIGFAAMCGGVVVLVLGTLAMG